MVKPFQQFLKESFGGLEIHQELNPALWTNDKLQESVKEHLLKFTQSWLKFSKIPSELVQDIIMTGGNCGYNYSEISDIDVHIVGEKSKLPIAQPFLDDYLHDKKHLWTLTHNVTVKGYSVEPYFQDVSEKFHAYQGAYSILHDKWVQHPTFKNIDYDNDTTLISKVNSYKDLIDKLVSTQGSQQTLRNLKDKISNERSANISEYSLGNLVFKSLRNEGYLDKIDNYVKPIEDKELSL